MKNGRNGCISFILKGPWLFYTGSPEWKVALPEKLTLKEEEKNAYRYLPYNKLEFNEKNLLTGMNKGKLQFTRQRWYLISKTSSLRDFNKYDSVDKNDTRTEDQQKQ